eukprot:scpid103592/ scgid3261/ 
MSPPFTSSTRSRYTSEHISLVLIRGHPLHSNYQVSGSDHVRNNLQTTLNQSSVQALGSHSTNIADNITQPAGPFVTSGPWLVDIVVTLSVAFRSTGVLFESSSTGMRSWLGAHDHD